jgi:hypothetical protein
MVNESTVANGGSRGEVASPTGRGNPAPTIARINQRLH